MWEEALDTKKGGGVIRIRKSKDRQHNDKSNRTKNDPLNTTHTTHTTKDRVTRTSIKIESELRCSGRVRSSCSTSCKIKVVSIVIQFGGKLTIGVKFELNV